MFDGKKNEAAVLMDTVNRYQITNLNVFLNVKISKPNFLIEKTTIVSF